MIAHFNSLSAEAIERRGGKKAWKGGVRQLRPKFWQRTKYTFERCTFVPLDLVTFSEFGGWDGSPDLVVSCLALKNSENQSLHLHC